MTTNQATYSSHLFIVATPIGNQDDITLRALSILKSVDFIIAEDTRHSAILCKNLGINKPMTSLHTFNERDKSEQLIASLCAGQSAALISDAGTPLISDPGFPLVKLARQKGVTVSPIPGPNALIAALSAAGVPCDSFSFAGFLPAKQAARIQDLTDWSALSHTLVFYEARHRIKECLQDIGQVFGESTPVVLVKELTKLFEHFQYGAPLELISWLEADNNHVKGEFVIIIPPRETRVDLTPLRKTLTILLSELPLKQAVKLACQLTDENKNTVYDLALAIKSTI